MNGRILIIFILAIVSAIGVYAGEYYVSPDGSDTNAGTQELPWSLEHANAQVQPGDTIILHNGIYNTPIHPARSGMKDRPIVYRALNPKKALFTKTLEGIDLNQYGHLHATINVMEKSYVTVEGITVKDVYRFVLGTHSDHITIDNCHFENASGWESCRFHPVGDGIRIINNFMKGGSDILSIGHGMNHLIENNVFDTASHTCLALRGIDYSVVRGNTFSNPTMKLMEVFSRKGERHAPCMHTLIEYNHFKYSGSYKKAGSASVAMTFTGKHVMVRRNIFTECQGGIFWFQQGAKGEASHNYGNRFYHNTMYNSGRPGGYKYNGIALIFAGRGNELYGENVVVNNILFFNHHYSGGHFRGFPRSLQIGFEQNIHPEHVRILNNLIFYEKPDEIVIGEMNRGRQGYSIRNFEKEYPQQAVGNIGADPQFVDAKKGNFRLTKNSPCIDAGRPLTETTTAGRGMVVKVKDATFFCDGFGIVEPDSIRIGNTRVQAVQVNYTTNAITLDRSISWNAGDPVSLDYEGKAPDIGVFEFGNNY